MADTDEITIAAGLLQQLPQPTIAAAAVILVALDEGRDGRQGSHVSSADYFCSGNMRSYKQKQGTTSDRPR